jgi:hypothetical protein
VHSHRNLNLLPKARQHRHQPVDRKAVELGLADAREIGGGNASHFVRGPDGQLPLIQHGNNPRRQQSAQLLAIRIGMPKVPKDIPTTLDNIEITLAHPSLSFSRFNRSFTKSISAFGVLNPRLRFLLERMQHPNIVIDLQRINHPESVAPMFKS